MSDNWGYGEIMIALIIICLFILALAGEGPIEVIAWILLISLAILYFL